MDDNEEDAHAFDGMVITLTYEVTNLFKPVVVTVVVKTVPKQVPSEAVSVVVDISVLEDAGLLLELLSFDETVEKVLLDKVLETILLELGVDDTLDGAHDAFGVLTIIETTLTTLLSDFVKTLLEVTVSVSQFVPGTVDLIVVNDVHEEAGIATITLYLVKTFLAESVETTV